MDVNQRMEVEADRAPRGGSLVASYRRWGSRSGVDAKELASQYLEPRGVTLDAFLASGGEVVADASVLDPLFPRCPAAVFHFLDPLTGDNLSYIGPDGAPRPFIHVRRLAGDGPKFLQPRNSGTHVYFAPCESLNWRTVFTDTSYGLVITEGETRALAGAAHDLPVIALTGVNCGQKDGDLHPDLAGIDWRGRTALLTFDSDAAHKPPVGHALGLLATLLRQRGALVYQVNLPPMPDGSKQGLDDYLARHGRDAFEALILSPQTFQIGDAEQYQRATPLVDLMATAFPPTEWVLEDFVLKGEVNLLYGDGGVGKSLLALYLGIAVAAGKPLFSVGTTHMPVLVLFAEDGPGQVKQRAETALIEMGLDHHGDLRMRLWCAPAGEVTLAQIADDGVVKELPRLRALRDELALLGTPALVILDSFADLFALNENLRLPVNAALKQVLGGLCRDFGATVLVLAHPSKASIVDGHKYSGSTAFNNGVRQRINLELVKDGSELLTTGPLPRRLSVEKSNYGARAEKTLFYWGTSIRELPQGPVMTEDDIKEAVLRAVLDMIDRGICVVRGTGSGQKPADVAKAIREKLGPSLSPQQVRDCLNSLERDEILAYRRSDKTKHKAVPASYVRGPRCLR